MSAMHFSQPESKARLIHAQTMLLQQDAADLSDDRDDTLEKMGLGKMEGGDKGAFASSTRRIGQSWHFQKSWRTWKS